MFGNSTLIVRLLFPSSVVVLALLSGCSALDLNIRDSRVHEWVTEGKSPGRINAVDVRIAPPLAEVWRLDAGAGFGSVSPLVLDNVVLVATRKGEVLAMDIENGRRLGQTTFGETIEGTPVYRGGVIYVPIGWGRRSLIAYDVSVGQTKWKVKGAPISTSLVLHGEKVVAADDLGGVTAYGLEKGESIWSVELGENVGVKATPAVADALLFVGDDTGHVTAVDLNDGSLVWSAEVGAPIYAALATDGEKVYVPTTRGRFYALDAGDGHVKWTVDLDDPEIYVGAPAVGPLEVVFGASDGMIRSVSNDDGSIVWSADAGAAVAAPPLLTDSHVYAGTMRSRLIAFSREDGGMVWETKLDGRIKSAFAVGNAGLIVLAEPRTVYFFRSESELHADNAE